jgi:general stress protein YciG
MPNSIMNPVAPFNPEKTDGKKKRGFASMDRDQVRELARRGGVAAHRAGTAHEFSSDEARAAGRKGGLAAHSAERKAGPADNSPNEPN